MLLLLALKAASLCLQPGHSVQLLLVVVVLIKALGLMSIGSLLSGSLIKQASRVVVRIFASGIMSTLTPAKFLCSCAFVIVVVDDIGGGAVVFVVLDASLNPSRLEEQMAACSSSFNWPAFKRFLSLLFAIG